MGFFGGFALGPPLFGLVFGQSWWMPIGVVLLACGLSLVLTRVRAAPGLQVVK